MRTSVHWNHLLAAVVGCVLFVGCGGDDPMAARPDIAAISMEEHYGASVKSMIYEFRAKVRKRGATAVNQELPLLLENLEGYEQQPLGDHAATYKEIVEKLKAMSGATSKDAAVKAANEVGTLADKLPGKANDNPVVE